MCVCGWQLVALAVFAQLLVVVYGELDGRRRSKVARQGEHRDQIDEPVHRPFHTTAPPPMSPSPTPASDAPTPAAERKGHRP